MRLSNLLYKEAFHQTHILPCFLSFYSCCCYLWELLLWIKTRYFLWGLMLILLLNNTSESSQFLQILVGHPSINRVTQHLGFFADH